MSKAGMSEAVMPPRRSSRPSRGSPDALHRCMEALVDVLIDECRSTLAPADRNVVKDYVGATLSAMPDYVLFGFRILALVFEVTALPAHGHRFTRLAATQRRRHVTAWRGSRIGFRRAMIAFYTTFTCYGLYSLPDALHPASSVRIAA